MSANVFTVYERRACRGFAEGQAAVGGEAETAVLDEALSEVRSLRVNGFTCNGWFEKTLLELRQSQDLLI